MRLFQYPSSGNCYKVRLLLSHLGIACERVTVDILRGDSRTPEYLAKNPNGKTPLLELDDGTFLPESNAILCYLADGSDYLPTDRLERARVMQWLFFEQYSHEPYIATARFWVSIKKEPDHPDARLAERHEKGHHALRVMEQHLGSNDWFAAGRYTIADIALHAYTHVADEGGFALDGYPNVSAWLARVKEQPEHVPITA